MWGEGGCEEKERGSGGGKEVEGGKVGWRERRAGGGNAYLELVLPSLGGWGWVEEVNGENLWLYVVG